jgi:hypothetical protein
MTNTDRKFSTVKTPLKSHLKWCYISVIFITLNNWLRLQIWITTILESRKTVMNYWPISPMVCVEPSTPYPWHLDSLTHGISNPLILLNSESSKTTMEYWHLPWHIQPLPMVYQTPFPRYFEPLPMVFWLSFHRIPNLSNHKLWVK